MASDFESDICMDDMDSDFDSLSNAVENPKPVKKGLMKTAKATDKQTKKASILTSSTNVANDVPSSKGGKKTVEEIYQKKTQLEHILLRPDTYIGSVERLTQPMFVLNGDRIVEREITYTPGLFKIFDEIIVNAADNKQRDPNMSNIDITIDANKNSISVRNNGKGIPIVLHQEHGVYIPTMIFGQLLTGSNFDDNEKKTTGGRNGYGAKLANVFSSEFIVECANVEYNLKFKQVFRKNMTVAEEPKVTSLSAAESKKGDYVQITFSPDLPRFGMTHLDDDTVGLLSKRAYDIAGTMASSEGKKLVVSLNGEKLKIKSFKEYLDCFDGIPSLVAYDKNDRWEVGVAPSPDQTPRNISFVNAICTSKGGQHVVYIADQIAAHLVKTIKKKNKGGAEIKPTQIKNNMTIFVNCLIENPAFDSQTKEFLTTRPKAFGSEFKVSEKFLKIVEKSVIVDMIISQADKKLDIALKRKGGVKKSKLTGIPKLDDANYAGTAKSKDCTLIITEGDSAKSLAMSGIAVVGRDYYGVFPLRGKLLNVRDASKAIVAKNVEIQHLVDILGLKYGTTYDETNVKSLRYGHLMIMTDQDTDGSHIKGLVINFIHKFWPSLLDVPGFLLQFITPIVKVTKGKQFSRSFFTIPEYEKWFESTGNNGKGFTIKYYKGLGTSTSAEAKEYFGNLIQHKIEFNTLENDKIRIDGDDCDEEVMKALPDNVVSGSDLIDMVFSKSRVNDRKNWLNTIQKDTYLDYLDEAKHGGVKYSNFINKEFILFSSYDNARSIPCLVDGFKPSQRKVLYGCFKRNLKGEVKVAQLTGYIAEHSAYHHGEASLQETIVRLAQDFVGSNNINLLTPSGQFGTRLMGGKDSASPRYIFTKLEAITRLIFHPDDDQLLSYLNDDGATIEPEYYVPVIPMLLVNGADGIGTGYSTNIPNYNPREVIANIRRMIAGQEPTTMHPYFSGFTGELIDQGKGSYEVRGRIERLDETTLFISELPLRKWTQDYKQLIEGMLTGEGTSPPQIKDFKENHTDTTVSFTIVAEKDKIDAWEQEKSGLYGKFKLTSTLNTSNMTAFDSNGKIIKFETPADIMKAFFGIRLDYYCRRKEALVKKLEAEQKMLSNKARFVEEVCSGKLVVSNRKRKDILADLQKRGYDIVTKPKTSTSNIDDDEDSIDFNDIEMTSDAELAKGYDYLLGMKIWSLTYEKAEALRAELAVKTEELNVLKATAPTQIWINDLNAIEVALDQRDKDFENMQADEKRAQQSQNGGKAKPGKGKAVPRKPKAVAKKQISAKKMDEWESAMAESDDEGPSGDDSDSDDFFDVKILKTIAPTKKVLSTDASTSSVVSQAAEASKNIPPAPPQDESDDELTESLAVRMKRKLIVSPATERISLGANKRPSPRDGLAEVSSIILQVESIDSLSSIEAPPSKALSKPNKKATAKKAPAKPKPVRGKKTMNKAKRIADSSESEDELSFKSDSENESVGTPAAAPQVARARRAARAKAPITYSYDDDDSSIE